MNNKDQHDIESQRITPGEVKSGSPVNTSRRAFAKTGLAASGILLTLSSRSSMAATVNCHSPSGFQSGNVSTAGGGHNFSCLGNKPAFWSTNPPPTWPAYSAGTAVAAPPWSDGTPFNSLPLVVQSSIYSTYTLMQVLQFAPPAAPLAGDSAAVGPYIVAAILNAKAGLTSPALTEAQSVAIFNSWVSSGTYTPIVGGPAWNDTQIVAYLLTTMPN